MTPAYTLKTAPTFEPLALSDLKDHLRVTSDAEDALIAAYGIAARQWVESHTQRALATQTWQVALKTWCSAVYLPMAAPLQSVTFVKYYDPSDVLQTWSASNYTVPAFQEPAVLRPVSSATRPSLADRWDAVQIEYVVGYAANACPEALRLAVMTLAAHFYENREATLVGATSKETEFAVTALCAPYRLWWPEPCH